jgi:hypothetical protein
LTAEAFILSGSAFNRQFTDGNQINNHLPDLRFRHGKGDADRCLRVFLRVHELQNCFETETRRLLCVLLIRIGKVSAETIRNRSAPDPRINEIGEQFMNPLCVCQSVAMAETLKIVAISRHKIRQNFPAARSNQFQTNRTNNITQTRKELNMSDLCQLLKTRDLTYGERV